MMVKDVKPEKQAEVVLYHFAGSLLTSGIQSKIALANAVEDQADGLVKVIEYMDSMRMKRQAWTKYKQFIHLKKDGANQPVTEFIAVFDQAHTKAKESRCEFSGIILGFNFLEPGNLNETDEKACHNSS